MSQSFSAFHCGTRQGISGSTVRSVTSQARTGPRVPEYVQPTGHIEDLITFGGTKETTEYPRISSVKAAGSPSPCFQSFYGVPSCPATLPEMLSPLRRRPTHLSNLMPLLSMRSSLLVMACICIPLTTSCPPPSAHSINHSAGMTGNNQLSACLSTHYTVIINFSPIHRLRTTNGKIQTQVRRSEAMDLRWCQRDLGSRYGPTKCRFLLPYAQSPATWTFQLTAWPFTSCGTHSRHFVPEWREIMLEQ